MAFTPTAEQQAVIEALNTGQNTVVVAGAGAGKTSTLKLAAAAMPHVSTAYFTFNKANAKEAAAAFPKAGAPNVESRTLHGFAWHAFVKNCPWRLSRSNDPTKVAWWDVAKVIRANEFVKIGERVVQPRTLTRIALDTVDNFCKRGDAELSWRHVPRVDGLDLTPEDRRAVAEAVLPMAIRAWDDLNRPDGKLYYSFHHYLKQWSLTNPVFGKWRVMMDEAQDSNGVAIHIAKCQPERVQIATVGDPNQAINEWNGAVDAMGLFDPVHTLFLTESFRYQQAIADEGNKFLELIDPENKMIRGAARHESTVGHLEVPDAVLCRSNAGAVESVMHYQALGFRPALVGGGDQILKFAQAAQQLMDGTVPEWHADLSVFETWEQVKEYVEQDNGGAEFKVAVRLVENEEFGGPEGIERAMSNLAPVGRAPITVSTAHKAKGLEWDTVQIGSDFYEPKRDDDTGAYVLRKDEMRLAYVAVTRARHALDVGSLSWVDEVLAEVRGDRAGLLAGEGIVRQVERIDVSPFQAPEPVKQAVCGALRDDGHYREQTCELDADHDGDHGPKNYDPQTARAYFWTNKALAVSA